METSIEVEQEWVVGAPHRHVLLLHLLALGLLLEVLKLLLRGVAQVAPLVLRQHLADFVRIPVFILYQSVPSSTLCTCRKDMGSPWVLTTDFS